MTRRPEHGESKSSRVQTIPRILSLFCDVAFSFLCLSTSELLGNLYVDIEAYQVMIDISIFVVQEMPVGFATLYEHNRVLNLFQYNLST